MESETRSTSLRCRSVSLRVTKRMRYATHTVILIREPRTQAGKACASKNLKDRSKKRTVGDAGPYKIKRYVSWCNIVYEKGFAHVPKEKTKKGRKPVGTGVPDGPYLMRCGNAANQTDLPGGPHIMRYTAGANFSKSKNLRDPFDFASLRSASLRVTVRGETCSIKAAGCRPPPYG